MIPVETLTLFFHWFPCVVVSIGGDAGPLVTPSPKYGYFRNLLPLSLLLAFSLHFFPPLPFSDLSSHSPPVVFLVF